MPQVERQPRWYANLTPEQREVRRIRQRERNRERYASEAEFRERKRESNARRIFAGHNYICMADSSEQAEMLKAHVASRLAGFLENQPNGGSALDPSR